MNPLLSQTTPKRAPETAIKVTPPNLSQEHQAFQLRILSNMMTAGGGSPPGGTSQYSWNHSPDNSGIDIWIAPGDASVETLTAVFVALSELHSAAGGAGLEFQDLGTDPEHQGFQKIRAVPRA